MKTEGSRAGPGVNGTREGPRGLDAPAAPRQGERNTQPTAYSYLNPRGDGVATFVGDGLRLSETDAVSYEVEVDPGNYFKRVTLTVEPDPYTREQQQFILDTVWGRWYQPPDGTGAAVPAPNRPPVLTGGATVEVETPAMTT